MHRPRQAEHHHVVARLQLGITLHQIAHTVSHKPGYGHLARKLQIFHKRFGHLRVFLHHLLGYLGIGKRQALGIALVVVD